MDFIQIYTSVISGFFLLSAIVSVYGYAHAEADIVDVTYAFVLFLLLLPMIGRIFNKW